ncbi:MAG: hypothetical protein O3B72_10830 [Proteobacteria bacterium]|nr:hypothetical protein [Pseudomonadota bacterium]
MIFIFGEKIRTRSESVGDKPCAVCQSTRAFTEQHESLWFCLFGLPIAPIEKTAAYWRCEHCLTAYHCNDSSQPSHITVLKQLIVYLLMGYHQEDHPAVASEICLKISGFEISETEFQQIMAGIARGDMEMVEAVRHLAPVVNAVGKQQVLEAVFLTTYICCDLEYEDRLRINLIGNALGVGLEFVEYAISQTRKQNYYGVRRLRFAADGVRQDF